MTLVCDLKHRTQARASSPREALFQRIAGTHWKPLVVQGLRHSNGILVCPGGAPESDGRPANQLLLAGPFEPSDVSEATRCGVLAGRCSLTQNRTLFPKSVSLRTQNESSSSLSDLMQQL